MIETDDLSEGLVLTVQVRQHALTVASNLVCAVPATLIEGDVPDVVLKYAQRFAGFMENGRIK